MMQTKSFGLLAALCAALIACLCASSALAGSRAGMSVIWDPAYHAPTRGDVIDLFSFRKLEQLTGDLNSASQNYAGRGELKNRCGAAGARHWCAMSVDYKLTNAGLHGSCGWVWSHLYVRPIGATSWRELSHYHNAMIGDCP